MTAPIVLLTGATGFIGRHLVEIARVEGQPFVELRNVLIKHGDDARPHFWDLCPRQLKAKTPNYMRLLDIRLAVPEQRRLCVMIGEALRLAPNLVPD